MSLAAAVVLVVGPDGPVAGVPVYPVHIANDAHDERTMSPTPVLTDASGVARLPSWVVEERKVKRLKRLSRRMRRSGTRSSCGTWAAPQFDVNAALVFPTAARPIEVTVSPGLTSTATIAPAQPWSVDLGRPLGSCSLRATLTGPPEPPGVPDRPVHVRGSEVILPYKTEWLHIKGQCEYGTLFATDNGAKLRVWVREGGPPGSSTSALD